MSSTPKTLSVQNIPGIPKDVAAIRAKITAFLDTIADNGKKVGDSKWGVYAFYDYDGEPIYVGQTNEKLRVRIRRHLTNHRTDAVAMNVLDPFEVKEAEVWPLWKLETEKAASALLCAAEYAVYRKVLKESMFSAVLNERVITPAPMEFKLPLSYRGVIIPEDLIEERSHPDIRIARRANTIAALAKVICERKVSKGLRRTLTIQAKRLEWLAAARFKQISGSAISDNEEED